MKRIVTLGQGVALLVALTVGALGIGNGAHAKTIPAASVPSRFLGQVAALTGTPNDPTGFTLVVKTHSIDFHVAPNTVYHALSAEADITGFVAGDFALVSARKIHRVWVANRIDFDVQPVVPDQMTFTGTVVRLSPDNHRLTVRLATGEFRIVTLTVRTRFKIGGQLLVSPPLFSRGDGVQVLARKTDKGLVAIEVNLHPNGAADL